MLRIAFCDDETEILEELESLTEQYCADRGCRMEYQAFHSPLELLAAMEKIFYIIWVMERCWRGTGGWNGWKNSLRNMETLFGFIVRFW